MCRSVWAGFLALAFLLRTYAGLLARPDRITGTKIYRASSEAALVTLARDEMQKGFWHPLHDGTFDRSSTRVSGIDMSEISGFIALYT